MKYHKSSLRTGRFPEIIRSGLISFFFPASCPVCGNELPAEGMPWICVACRGELAKPMDGDMGDFRKTCDEFPLVTYYTRFGYDEMAGEVVRQVKYRERRALLDLIVPSVAELAEALMERYNLDMLLPVPLHPRKERERGFNQSALIAETVAARSGLRCQVRALERSRYTRQQTRLKGGKRLANVSGAFAVRDAAAVAGKRILLLDDVITTGATAAHCVYALWPAGAEMVVVLGVAGSG